MQINNLDSSARYSALQQMETRKSAELKNAVKNGQKLEETAAEFTSIFIEKMFSAMRNTLSDEKLIDGGYAEDVFTDMLYKEYSLMAGKQGLLADLNRKLVVQLRSE
ncbi:MULTISPECIES: rod-binding protein [unclassified Halanaerobium]|uniref:rod-binding protein n=1 Tax=unclassified Halanaerobium TaxID=2641197 RepID=UPI000DF1F75C|nr:MULTISPECIES: rod-binding protein [unclassified Halanaerobium]RCW47662.1 flagellar protein FlgJ [Halanaerobium sp. MA284_MarDTE_T2]RCW84694.1 flagellar protein FlgJ [Halanaerobium sp. DL-01]